MYILDTNMYTLGVNMYIFGANMYHFGKKVYLFKRYNPSYSFCTFFSESVLSFLLAFLLFIFISGLVIVFLVRSFKLFNKNDIFNDGRTENHCFG